MSAITGEGLDAVGKAIEDILATGSEVIELTLSPEAGAARAWLFEHGEVGAEKPVNGDGGDIVMSVRMSSANLARFRRLFPAADHKEAH